MIAKLAYQYASGDLLETRNTYFYSPFRGADFLHAWREQRDRASTELLLGIRLHSEDVPNSPTEVLLESIATVLSGTRDRREGFLLLDRLVQRFEVTKRMHGEYNDRWRPVDQSDYRNLAPYVRFAEVLELAYRSTAMLPYLNALLKCLDTLTALGDSLKGRQRSRVSILIESEEIHVKALVEKLSWGAYGA